MMNQSYPNAAGGLKLLFLAQILAIVSMAVLILGVAAAEVSGLAAAVLLGAVVAIVSYVLQIMGLNKATQDDEGYRSAMMIAIAGLVVNLLNNFWMSDVPVIGTLLSLVGGVLSFLMVNMICRTTGNLLRSAGNDALADRGATVAKIYLICTVVDIVCTVVGIIPILNTLSGLVSVIAGIVQLVGYIMYLTFLNGSSKAL